MLYWPRKFPWLNENQVKWLEEQTATLPSDKKEWAQQELYRKVLPFIIGREFKENRAVLKNEIYNQSLQEQDVYKKNSIQSKLRREDLADLVKEKRNLSPQAPTDQLFNAIVKEADYRGIDRSLINDYLAGKNEDFLYEMELKERPFEDYSKADTLQQGGIKGLATRIAGDWGRGEWVNPVGKLTGMIDDLVQKIPTMSVEDWNKLSREKLWGFGEGMGNVPTMLINAPWSLLKTTSWISRAMTNPLDTAVGLGTLFFSSEGHQALKQRYWDQIQKTATEDPVGLASDILTVISPIAKGLGGATSFIGETGKSWSLVKAGGNITKFWETAGKAGDLWLGIIQENLLWKLSSAIAEKSGWTKWGLKYLQFTQEPLKVAKDYAQHILKVDDLVGLDAKTKQALENNPYVAKWREKTKKRIEDIGISPENKKEVNTEHIQELSDEIINLIDKKKEGLQDVGGLYQAIKDENVAVDNSLTDLALDRYLEEKGIKIKDGKFDFSDSVIVKDSDMKAIERAYEWATRPEYEATTALNQRKKLDKLAYPEGQPSAGTEVIKGMRELFDKNLKETIPGLKDVDKIYSQKIKEYNEIREGLVYKDSNRKWSIRDNFNQIINTLDWPNRARMLERLEELRPGLGDEIRAVHMMGKLSDLYFKTPKQLHNVATKIGGATLWAVGGFQYGGIGGSIAGAIAGFLTELWVRKFSQKRIQNTIDGLSPDSKVRLEAIEKKIQENKGISPQERQLLDSLGKDIIQKSKVYKENLDKLGAMKLSDFVENGEQKNLPKGKEPTSVDGTAIDKGLNKLREWAETKYQLAEPIKSENFKKWFGDWENDPKNASKVVNEKGEPLMMYHGTSSDFNIFDKKLIKSTNYGKGFYFTSDLSKAQQYGENIKAVYLDVKNPLDITTPANDAEFNKWYNKKNSPYDGYIVSFNDGEKMVVVNSSSQIKSATDNIGTFDANNPDIRYQKHGVANPLEKDISAQRATQIQNIRNGKSVEQIAKDYGVDIKIVDKITTPEGLRAYGKYGDGVITLAEKIKEGTAPHELFHATFDMVDHARKESILRQIEKSKGLDSLNAEEYLADSFSEYFRTGKFDTKTFGKGLVEKIKQYFYQVKQFITGANKNKAQVKKLFDEILDGEIDRDMLGEVLENKKGDATLNQLQEAEGSLVTSPKKSIQINPNNARDFKKNLNNINVSQLNPESFLITLKQALGVWGESSYINNTLGDWRYTLRVSNHNANARNHKVRWNLENNTSVVIKLSDSRFKAKNGVDLIEFVYDPAKLTPEKMQGIIKGIQDWIDSGEYTDKGYDATHTSVRATLENGEVKYQRVYHGSPYEFEKFDSAQMGKWEGAQAHGWGHYVAVDKKTGIAYAENNPKVEYKWTQLNEFVDNIANAEQEEVSKIMWSMQGLNNNFEMAKKQRMSDLMEWKSMLEDDLEYVDKNSKTYKDIESQVKQINKSLDYLSKLNESDFVKNNGNLYEVEIPDTVKVETPTGSNYLEESWKIKSKAVDRIVKKLKEWLSEEKLAELDELIDSRESWYDHSIEWWRMYRILERILWSDKKASKFLEGLWYDGIHYHWGQDWEVYVIFDDNKLEIKKHEKL